MKGAASEEGPPVVADAQITTAQILAAGQLLHCSRGCFAGYGDLEDDAECRWPLRGTSNLSRSDPAVHQHQGRISYLCVRLSPVLMLPSSPCFPSPVPTFPQERWQQTTDHATAEEEIQEPHNPGLQDPCSGHH